MAHQLNTDYLRRKLLDPQRQVSSIVILVQSLLILLLTPSLPSIPLPLPLPRSPAIRALFFVFSSITTVLQPETRALGLCSVFAVAIHNTHCMNTWSCLLPIPTCHINPRVPLVTSTAELLELVQIILIRLFGSRASFQSYKPSGRKLFLLSYLVFIPNTILHTSHFTIPIQI